MKNHPEVKERKNPKGQILLVDDEQLVRKFIPFPLMADGFEVTTVSKGNEVLELLRENPDKYNLILSDIGLLDINGIEMGKQIRENPQTARIPIVYMSGDLSEEKLEKIKQLGGITLVLKKPTPNKELVAAVNQALDKVKKSTT